MKEITDELYDRLKYLGIIPNEVSRTKLGNSDYHDHTIQPWAIWLDYGLNPWDADIVKRVLRIKEDAGYSSEDHRILDYKKIKHICDERIRQLQIET